MELTLTLIYHCTENTVTDHSAGTVQKDKDRSEIICSLENKQIQEAVFDPTTVNYPKHDWNHMLYVCLLSLCLCR